MTQTLLILAFLVLVAALAGWFYRQRRAGVAVRPAVAVLGFENLSRQQSTEWLSTALTEMLSTELAAGGGVRSVPGELVSRVKLDLALPNAQTFTKSTLGRLRGSYSLHLGQRHRVPLDPGASRGRNMKTVQHQFQ